MSTCHMSSCNTKQDHREFLEFKTIQTLSKYTLNSNEIIKWLIKCWLSISDEHLLLTSRITEEKEKQENYTWLQSQP